MQISTFVVLVHAAAAVVLGSIYFRRFQVTRPPLGVFNLWDVAALLGAVVALPYVYLLAPRSLAVALLGGGCLGILYLVGEPVLRRPRRLWPAALALLGADIGASLLAGTTSAVFLAVNNALLVIVVVGVTNQWAQSGMKARDLALLAAALAVYDVIATAWLPLTGDLLGRLTAGPFAPQVAWPAADGGLAGIGLGDLLLATVGPLALRKAFGRAAGVAAMAFALAAIGAMFTLPSLGVSVGLFPAMVVLGPLLAAQYAYWRVRRGPERTTWQYHQAEPLRPRRRGAARAIPTVVPGKTAAALPLPTHGT